MSEDANKKLQEAWQRHRVAVDYFRYEDPTLVANHCKEVFNDLLPIALAADPSFDIKELLSPSRHPNGQFAAHQAFLPSSGIGGLAGRAEAVIDKIKSNNVLIEGRLKSDAKRFVTLYVLEKREKGFAARDTYFKAFKEINNAVDKDCKMTIDDFNSYVSGLKKLTLGGRILEVVKRKTGRGVYEKGPDFYGEYARVIDLLERI